MSGSLIAEFTFPDTTMLVGVGGPGTWIEDHPGVVRSPWPPVPEQVEKGWDSNTERCETCGKQWGTHRTIQVVFERLAAMEGR